MERNLYYCEIWNHRNFVINTKKYQICISPKINGNTQGTVIQFHGILLKDKKVVRIGELDKKISIEEASKLLEGFEEKIRRIIRSFVSWNSNSIDNGVVKIWYYDEDSTNANFNMNDKRKYPPLRFAITVININILDDKTSNILRDSLENAIMEWLNNVLSSY